MGLSLRGLAQRLPGFHRERPLRSVAASAFQGDGVVFLIGMPRSGTSWLAKIFDSHPDVLYRHEPDFVLQSEAVPWNCGRDEIEGHLGAARNFLGQLATVRTLKSAGPLPVFPKRHRTMPARLLRTCLILALRAAATAAGREAWPEQVAIPDFIAERHRRNMPIVIKSVGAIGRARLFAEAWPASRIIVILRHPCGQIASTMRGMALRKLPDPGQPRALFATSQAARMGLSEDDASRLSVVEQLAWRWGLDNQKLLDELDRPGQVRIVRYEDLAADPASVARDLFAFGGIPWDAQTERFIEKSTTAGRRGGYFSIMRDPIDAAQKWREELASEDQERILAIARRFSVGCLCALPEVREHENAETATPLATRSPA